MTDLPGCKIHIVKVEDKLMDGHPIHPASNNGKRMAAHPYARERHDLEDAEILNASISHLGPVIGTATGLRTRETFNADVYRLQHCRRDIV